MNSPGYGISIGIFNKLARLAVFCNEMREGSPSHIFPRRYTASLFERKKDQGQSDVMELFPLVLLLLRHQGRRRVPSPPP